MPSLQQLYPLPPPLLNRWLYQISLTSEVCCYVCMLWLCLSKSRNFSKHLQCMEILKANISRALADAFTRTYPVWHFIFLHKLLLISNRCLAGSLIEPCNFTEAWVAWNYDKSVQGASAVAKISRLLPLARPPSPPGRSLSAGNLCEYTELRKSGDTLHTFHS